MAERGNPVQSEDFIWLPHIVDKIFAKYHVTPYEVEEVFSGQPRIFRGPKGHYPGEDVYYALGATEASRYLFIVYINQKEGWAGFDFIGSRYVR